jgi:spermidine synthase
MAALGRHIIVEFYNCTPEKINDVVHIEKSMVGSAEEAGATVINSTFHHFSPYGVSGVVVIQESHLAIHTWPEYGYASVDLYTCGDTVDPWVSHRYLKQALGAGHSSALEMSRGEMQLLKAKDLDLNILRDQRTQNLKKHPEHEDVIRTRDVWFTERDEHVALSLKHAGDKLYDKTSPYQRVEVYSTFAYGNMLTLDGMVMCTENDEYVYHEMVAHVPMFSLKQPKKALIIGGGDGGTARELLRHNSLDEVVMVEIDDKVVEACKQFLPGVAVELDNPRLNLKIADGINYVKESPDETFDLVVVDSTDPVGPSEGLFTESFYKQVHRILTPNGVMVTQSESPRFNTKVFQEVYNLYDNIYGASQVFCYLAHIPTYPTGMWSFSFCSKGNTSPHEVDLDAVARFSKEQKLQYYNEGIHCSAFALPNFVKELIGK